MARLTHGLVKLDDQYAIYLAQHSAASFSSGISLISPVDNRVAIDADRDQQCFDRQLQIYAVSRTAALPSLQFARAASGTVHDGFSAEIPN
jgi:hypothetical protein